MCGCWQALVTLSAAGVIVATGVSHSERAVADAALAAVGVAAQARARRGGLCTSPLTHSCSLSLPCRFSTDAAAAAAAAAQVAGMRLEVVSAPSVEALVTHALVPAVYEAVARDPLLFDRMAGE